MTEFKNNPFSFWMKGETLEVWSEQMGIPLTNDHPTFAWVDIETSGLDRKLDRIFELGIVLTNHIGEVCRHEGIIDWRVFIHDPDDERYPEYRKALTRAEENVIVRDMHIKSGLIKDIMNDARHPESWKAHPSTVQVQAREWLTEVFGDEGSNKNLQLSGSSPHFDRGFLQDQMPYLEDWFHYRSGVDVSGAARDVQADQPEAVVKTAAREVREAPTNSGPGRFDPAVPAHAQDWLHAGLRRARAYRCAGPDRRDRPERSGVRLRGRPGCSAVARDDPDFRRQPLHGEELARPDRHPVMALSDIFRIWDELFIMREAGLVEPTRVDTIEGGAIVLGTSMASGYEPPSMALTISDGKEHCSECGREIKTMAFKGTGACGELCRKVNDGEITKEQADEVRTARASAHPRA
jgi:oligoribonuclease (3'-5' exoribonuclease)